jgi:AcrR family transcriptional regulator
VGGHLRVGRPRSEGTNDQKAKARLLEVATALFAEKGYASTSVGEIVAQARVSRPVLYYYFGSKEGLFQAILGEAMRVQEAVLSQALREDGPALARLTLLFEQVYREVVERPYLYRLLHNLAAAPPQGIPNFDLEPFHRRMVDSVRDVLEEAQRQGSLAQCDPEEAAFLVLGVLSLCLDLDQCYPVRADTSRLSRLLHLAFRGLEPREA